MTDTYYIAVGSGTADYIDNIDNTVPDSDIFKKTGIISPHGEKQRDVFSIDFSSTGYEEFRKKILTAYDEYREKITHANIAKEANLAFLLERMDNPDKFNVLLPADPERAQWLNGIFKESWDIERTNQAIGGPVPNAVFLSFDKSRLTDTQREELKTYYEEINKTATTPEQIVSTYGVNYLNLYLFAEANKAEETTAPPAREDHPAFDFDASGSIDGGREAQLFPEPLGIRELRDKLRSFVPPLHVYFMAGVGNSSLTTSHYSTTGTQTFALTEERLCPCPEPSDSNSGGRRQIDGPNNYPAYVGAAFPLLGIYPGLPAESPTMRSSPSYVGVQLYAFIETGFLTMPFEGKTMGAYELVVGPGLRTNLIEVANNSHGSFVVLPGVEFGGGLSTLITTGENGSTFFGRLIAFGWYGISRFLNGSELLVQLTRHDWGNSEMDNLLPSLAWTGGHEAAWLLVRFSWGVRPLEIPKPRPEPKPPPPVSCAEPEPVEVIEGLVISLPEINFATDQPDQKNADQLCSLIHEKRKHPWTLEELEDFWKILENRIFEPTKYNLRALARIANRLNEEDLKNHKIHIISHTDTRGDDQYNMTLAHKRSHTIKDILILLGVDQNRLITVARGETEPKIEETFDEGSADMDKARAGNRRTEFVVGEKM